MSPWQVSAAEAARRRREAAYALEERRAIQELERQEEREWTARR